jgi:shikimate dehydrogenase
MSHPERFLLAGVMGFPVMHSRSPMLHNYWFAQHKLAGTYVPLEIRPERLEAALRALPALGFAGCNLTIPQKETAFRFVDEVDETARKIGAISCVTVRADGSLHGSNNDSFGFAEGLLEACPDWRADAGPAVVIGAGGAARAVVHALGQRGAREIRLINRTRGRAATLAAEMGGPVDVLGWEDRHAALAGAALLVNTTSQGMVGYPPLELDLGALPAAAIVSDVIYIPGETPLLAASRQRGHRTVNGLGMLLHQARPAWRAWFGVDPQVTPEMRRLIEATI